MIRKKLLLFLFYFQGIFSMAEVAQFGIQLFTSSMQKIAEVKEQTEAYKTEIIKGLKVLTNLADKERAKTNNLEIISSIKNTLVKKMQLHKDENVTVFGVLTKKIYTSYKKFITLMKQFQIKYGQLSSQHKNSMLMKVAIFIIKSTLSEYLALLSQYNYQLQNVSQKIQTKNQFNSVYTEISENIKFVDPLIDIELSMKSLYQLVSNIDSQSDSLMRFRDLLLSNNALLFNTITNQILDIIDNAHKNESNKNINDPSQIFYNLSDQLSLFENKLFDSINEFEDSQTEAEYSLYKTIALLEINYNKIKKVILYMDNVINNKNYIIADFVKDLYKESLEINKTVKKSKNNYIASASKNNIEFNNLLKTLKDSLFFLMQNINSLQFLSLNQFFNDLNNIIFNYRSLVEFKNKAFKDEGLYFSYIDNYLIDVKKNAIKFQVKIKNINKKSEKSMNPSDINFSALPKISAIPSKNVFDDVRVNNKKNSKGSRHMVKKESIKIHHNNKMKDKKKEGLKDHEKDNALIIEKNHVHDVLKKKHNKAIVKSKINHNNKKEKKV